MSRKTGCYADVQLGLPETGWFRRVRELSSALGVGSEFGNANRLLQRWSGICISEKTFANHVEADGSELFEVEAQSTLAGACPVRSSVSEAAAPPPARPVFYIGADGIHTPNAKRRHVRSKSRGDVLGTLTICGLPRPGSL